MKLYTHLCLFYILFFCLSIVIGRLTSMVMGIYPDDFFCDGRILMFLQFGMLGGFIDFILMVPVVMLATGIYFLLDNYRFI